MLRHFDTATLRHLALFLLIAVGVAAEGARLQRHIDATDQQIDALVSELYGLTEEERRIVEEK